MIESFTIIEEEDILLSPINGNPASLVKKALRLNTIYMLGKGNDLGLNNLGIDILVYYEYYGGTYYPKRINISDGSEDNIIIDCNLDNKLWLAYGDQETYDRLYSTIMLIE